MLSAVAKKINLYYRDYYSTIYKTTLVFFSEMGRSFIDLESTRVWWCGVTLCSIRFYLATRHCPLQQVCTCILLKCTYPQAFMI